MTRRLNEVLNPKLDIVKIEITIGSAIALQVMLNDNSSQVEDGFGRTRKPRTSDL